MKGIPAGDKLCGNSPEILTIGNKIISNNGTITISAGIYIIKIHFYATRASNGYGTASYSLIRLKNDNTTEVINTFGSYGSNNYGHGGGTIPYIYTTTIQETIYVKASYSGASAQGIQSVEVIGY